jgi:hypothetical protein
MDDHTLLVLTAQWRTLQRMMKHTHWALFTGPGVPEATAVLATHWLDGLINDMASLNVNLLQHVDPTGEERSV